MQKVYANYHEQLYVCRVLPSKDGKGMIIGSIDLYNAICDELESFKDEWALYLDKSLDIIMYVEADLETISDSDLAALVCKNNPDWGYEFDPSIAPEGYND